MKYAISILASHIRYEGINRIQNTNHSTCVIEAVSDAEAEGLAMRFCVARYPKSEGWQNHSTAWSDSIEPILLEDVKPIKAPR